MSTSQRVGRSFHRLGVFLAAIPLIAGVVTSVLIAMGGAKEAQNKHEQLLCAREKIQQADKQLSERKTGETITYEEAASSRAAFVVEAGLFDYQTDALATFADIQDKYPALTRRRSSRRGEGGPWLQGVSITRRPTLWPIQLPHRRAGLYA
jgi:hypothetical protein